MNDLTSYFPGVTLNTEEIRSVIRNVTGMLENQNEIFYFCYKCFKYIGVNKPSGLLCKVCFQFYCKDCSLLLSVNRGSKEIDPKRCLQCLENQKNSVGI